MNLTQSSRPRRLAELVGQPAVTAILQPQLESGSVGPVLLLAGPRGTGKTSLARIIAASLNCERTPGLEPCGECASCRAMARPAPSSENYLELDAGTNGGVDQARALVAEAAIPVAPGKTRIVVLDECHLLSTAAASALLKTLEEPPPRVIFLLATTDPQRLLPTIRSRCMELPFLGLSEADTAARLAELAAANDLPLEGERVLAIARAAAGDMRRALTLLQLAATSPEALALIDTTGGSPELIAAQLLEAIAAGEFAKAAGLGRLLVAAQSGLSGALAQLGTQLYRLNLLASAGADQQELGVSQLEFRHLQQAAGLVSPARAQQWSECLVSSWSVLEAAPLQAEAALGLVLLRLLRAEASQPAAAIAVRSPAVAPGPAPGARVHEQQPPADAAAWPAALASLEPGLAELLGKAELVSLENGLAVLRGSGLLRQRLKPRLAEAAAALGLALELVP
jgi:DNA polymerase-3 subunit gamma/tau